MPAGVVSALAAVVGALVVGSVLLVWVGTPSVEKHEGRKRRLGANDLEALGASLSAAGKAAVMVGGAMGAFPLLTLPFLVPNAVTPTEATPGNAVPRGDAGTPASAEHTTSSALTWRTIAAPAAMPASTPPTVVQISSSASTRGTPRS